MEKSGHVWLKRNDWKDKRNPGKKNVIFRSKNLWAIFSYRCLVSAPTFFCFCWCWDVWLLWNSTSCFSCKPSLLSVPISPVLSTISSSISTPWPQASAFAISGFVSELIQQAANRRHSSLNRNMRWKENSGQTGRKLKLGEREVWRWEMKVEKYTASNWNF